MLVHALNVGKIQRLNGFRTAFAKEPATGPVLLGALGFAGDEQADKKHHGGPEKAVCCYPLVHYAYWEAFSGRPLLPPVFGENLTLSDCTEETVSIGDRYRLGTAIVQVCQPRVPCNTLVKRHDLPAILKQATKTGYTGFYLRVLTEGLVAPGDRMELLERPADALTIAAANEIFYGQRKDRAAVTRLLATPALAEQWREWATNRLNK